MNLIVGLPYEDEASLLRTQDIVRKSDYIDFWNWWPLQIHDKNNFEYWNVLIQNGTLSNNQSAAPADPRSNIQGGAYGYFSAHSVSKQTFVVK
jgi:hypothetical protein